MHSATAAGSWQLLPYCVLLNPRKSNFTITDSHRSSCVGHDPLGERTSICRHTCCGVVGSSSACSADGGTCIEKQGDKKDGRHSAHNNYGKVNCLAPSASSRRPPRHRVEFDGFNGLDEFKGFPGKEGLQQPQMCWSRI
jgi:hypothetical protein